MATKTVNLAKVIYDSFPDTDMLTIDPKKDLKDMQTLYNAVTSISPAELGDGLFRFVVVEAMEAGEQADGTVDAFAVRRALERAVEDLQSVISAVEDVEE